MTSDYVPVKEWADYGHTLAAYIDGQWKPFLADRVYFHMPFVDGTQVANKMLIQSILEKQK